MVKTIKLLILVNSILLIFSSFIYSKDVKIDANNIKNNDNKSGYYLRIIYFDEKTKLNNNIINENTNREIKVNDLIETPSNNFCKIKIWKTTDQLSKDNFMFHFVIYPNSKFKIGELEEGYIKYSVTKGKFKNILSIKNL